jgi:hypothetical protein
MENTTTTIAVMAALGFLGDEDAALMLLADASDYYKAAKDRKNESDTQAALSEALYYAFAPLKKSNKCDGILTTPKFSDP